MTRIALITAAAARNLDDDLPPLTAALREAGADASIVDWHDETVDWPRFDLALLRSTWDYTERPAEFLAWIDRAASATTVANPPAVVRWNSDKHYLADLERANLPIVSSTFVEPGEDPRTALSRFAERCEREFVVKPAVGAGSRDARRYAREELDAAVEHARRLLDANRSVLLQPYLDHVDVAGETALIFFEGAFSHAIRKGPLLRRGEDPTRALFATEHITPREPDAAEIDVAKRTLAVNPFSKPLLYARVDLIRDDTGAPCVLELELTEPSLFFAHAPGSARRFARAIVGRAHA
jgi:O-ureido-D-serine cyclo-ligase